MKLAEKLKKKRLELDLSMARLRDITGVSATYISKIENGFIPSKQILSKLAEALQMDTMELMRTAEYEKNPEFFEYLQGESDTVEFVGQELPIAQMIPIIDSTEAGAWREVVDAYQPGRGFDEVAVSSRRKDLVALRVKGASMEPVIRDGQVVVVDPHREAQNGDIVVVVKDQQSTIKRLHQIDEDTVILEPLNPAYERITLTRFDSADMRVVGVVIEIKLFL